MLLPVLHAAVRRAGRRGPRNARRPANILQLSENHRTSEHHWWEGAPIFRPYGDCLHASLKDAGGQTVCLGNANAARSRSVDDTGLGCGWSKDYMGEICPRTSGSAPFGPYRRMERAAILLSKTSLPAFRTSCPEFGRFGLFAGSFRTYLHFRPVRPEDWELPEETMPVNISEVLKKDPRELDFFENYWYWKVRSEATLLDPEKLPKKSYRQLTFDMGMQTINEKNEHLVGLLELYEYTFIAPMVGPFGTLENPVIIPSVCNERVVCCTGGSGDNEHYEMYFRCREGFLYRCGECDQIFMLVRVMYTLPEGVDPFPVDPDIDDVFDMDLLERGQRLWNIGEYVYWPAGNLAYKRAFMDGDFGCDLAELEGTLGENLRLDTGGCRKHLRLAPSSSPDAEQTSPGR